VRSARICVYNGIVPSSSVSAQHVYPSYHYVMHIRGPFPKSYLEHIQGHLRTIHFVDYERTSRSDKPKDSSCIFLEILQHLILSKFI